MLRGKENGRNDIFPPYKGQRTDRENTCNENPASEEWSTRDHRRDVNCSKAWIGRWARCLLNWPPPQAWNCTFRVILCHPGSDQLNQLRDYGQTICQTVAPLRAKPAAGEPASPQTAQQQKQTACGAAKGQPGDLV